MRETSQRYLPFGIYHFIHGAQIRTPDPPPSEQAGSASRHAEYAECVRHHLDARHLPKIAWLTGGRTGGLMDHKVWYRVCIYLYMLLYSVCFVVPAAAGKLCQMSPKSQSL